MASNSFCSRSAGSQASTAGNGSAARVDGPPNSSDCPIATSSWVRCAAASMASTAAKTRARFGLQRVEGARRREAFEHALVDGARIDAAGEIGEIGERPLGARLDDRLDRLPAHAFERGERVVDGVARDLEGDAGAVDRRRLDLDAEALRLGAELGELVGIAHVERHRGGQELDRIVRLHVGGLIGDQRVGGGVALVEAVVGEALEQLEDRLGLPAVEPALDAAGHEAAALRLHLLADLLAHGAAQQVGFAERIAGEHLRRLHHLLLIDDDAEGLAQDRLELGMDVVGLLASVLARAIGRDVGHRARPVERDQRDDVLEPVRAACRAAPAACPDFPVGRCPPPRRAPAWRRSSRRRAGSPPARSRRRAGASARPRSPARSAS